MPKNNLTWNLFLMGISFFLLSLALLAIAYAGSITGGVPLLGTALTAFLSGSSTVLSTICFWSASVIKITEWVMDHSDKRAVMKLESELKQNSG